MGAFSVGKITEAGRALLSKALAGSGIIFTRMEITDNSGNSHSMNINRLLHKECLVIESTVYSSDMDKSLWVINLNLYAKATANDKEILFISANDKNPDFIPKMADDSMCVGVTYTMQVVIDNVDNITFERTENAIVNMDILNDILLAKELPVKFVQNNDGDIIIEENPVKIGIPGYVS
jgi:hypothetical protein